MEHGPSLRLANDNAALVEAIAYRVVELLTSSNVSPTRLAGSRVLTCRQVAERLGRSMDWVRAHRDELGKVPGVGARPRLLFDTEAVDAWTTARDDDVRSVAQDPAPLLATPRPGPRSLSNAPDLLPIRAPVVAREAA